MIRRLTGLALAGMLLLPGAALAADPTPATPVATAHYYALAAVEIGATAVKAEGKLWIEGGKLGVTVGCNSIRAAVTFDGKRLTITGGISTTEMVCPTTIAPVEAALLKALGAGPFTWDGSGFSGNGARITATEVGTGPVTPPDTITVEPAIPFDPMACKDLVTPEEWAAAFGSDGPVGADGTSPGSNPGAASGSAGSGSMSSGSTSGGSGGTVGTDGATTQVAPGPPLPVSVPGSRPAVTAVGSPAPAVDLPLASGRPQPLPPASKDAPVGTPGPGSTPGPELCRELLARIAVMASNGMAMPKSALQATPGAGLGEGDTARDAAASRFGGPAAAITFLVVGLLLVAWLRSVGRPGSGAADR